MPSASPWLATLRPTTTLADALLPPAVRDRLGGLARDLALELAAANGRNPAETIRKGLGPFLVGDGFKLLLAAGVVPAIRRVVGRQR